MAAVPCKRLFLVAFLILCFFSIQATAARRLREAGNESQIGHDDPSSPKEERMLESADEFVAADYTPARRKPPIHN
ncbi:hypothetical protein FH972_002787 [Carpinus fangiana]|uniref:Root meristem growth factor 9 n=1 Tax=Carpinus fangiana TaxID=176857 RepID=A0A5N6QFX6_9ROSI|nr:hypothetical protein FH972_002787 [Carpinus fangiana]